MSVLDPTSSSTTTAGPTGAPPAAGPDRVELPDALRHRGWLGVLGIGLALFALAQGASALTRNVNFLPTTLLLGSALVPLTYVVFLRQRPLPFGVSGSLLAGTTFFGGVVGVLVAGVVEDALGLRRSSVPDMFVVGVVEETAKLLVPLLLLVLLGRRLRTADGILLGAASGAGFATLETMGYGLAALLGRDGQGIGDGVVLLARGITSPAAHMTWTALTFGALVAAATAARRGPALLRLAGAFVLAVVLHGLWDAPAGEVVTLLLHVGVAVVGLGLLTLVVRRLEHLPPRSERRRLRRAGRRLRGRPRPGQGTPGASATRATGQG